MNYILLAVLLTLIVGNVEAKTALICHPDGTCDLVIIQE